MSSNNKSWFPFPKRTVTGDLLESRIFYTASLVFFLLSAVITAMVSFEDSLLWIRVTLSVLSLIFLTIFYNAQYKERQLLSTRVFALLTLVFNDVAWCWSISSGPAAYYFFILIIVLDLTILKVKDHLPFMVIAVFNHTAIEYLAYRFPEHVLNKPELIQNLTFPFPEHYRLTSLAILIYLVLTFFKMNYERERANSELKSRQLINNNAALRHRNEHLESMARMVSHNLRSPMAGLKMIMQLFDRVETTEEKVELLENFKEGSQVMFDMVDDFSDILMDYRELVKDLETLKLDTVLKTVKKQLAGQIKESNATIHTNFSCSEVVYSKLFLESIFLNMLSNAIKYAKDGVPPEIEISSYIDDNRVMLLFSDNGIGIDLLKHSDKIFKMYRTFHNKKTVDSKGVGLFITKNQVEIMGGKIQIESQPEMGTKFFIELYRL